MKKKTWKSRIKKACQDAGTYKPYFDNVIDALAGVLEVRDQAKETFDESGEGMVKEQTNKSGFTNMVKNPLFSVWEDMNKLALTYMTALGLTPAGLKKINDEAFNKDKGKESANNLLGMLAVVKEVNK